MNKTSLSSCLSESSFSRGHCPANPAPPAAGRATGMGLRGRAGARKVRPTDLPSPSSVPFSYASVSPTSKADEAEVAPHQEVKRQPQTFKSKAFATVQPGTVQFSGH